MSCVRRETCRVCAAPLEPVLDLGEQHLQGQFPAANDPDPPAYPLELCRCIGCDLVQLRHTVSTDEMYGNYWYRSGVTRTMRDHLHALALEAQKRMGNLDRLSILDIGCNDGTLLGSFPNWARYGIDPSGVPYAGPPNTKIVRGTFPHADITGSFNLITSVACFYDVDDPVAFAEAVAEHLTPGGYWCVEVADLRCMLANGSYDAICHEHLTYFDIHTLADVCRRAGLAVVDYGYNSCNGGSIRAWVRHARHGAAPIPVAPDYYRHNLKTMLERFAARVEQSRLTLRNMLGSFVTAGESIHLLGASTKANTVLQYCGLSGKHIAFASDRDPRKTGRRTPGSNIPIISEELSRSMNPGVYLTTLQHFRPELLERERYFLEGGGKIVFALPVAEVVQKEAALC